MKKMNYLVDHTLYQILRYSVQDYFEYIIKNHETVIDNLLIRRDVNEIENRIKFKIKTGYYLELLFLKQ